MSCVVFHVEFKCNEFFQNNQQSSDWLRYGNKASQKFSIRFLANFFFIGKPAETALARDARKIQKSKISNNFRNTWYTDTPKGSKHEMQVHFEMVCPQRRTYVCQKWDLRISDIICSLESRLKLLKFVFCTLGSARVPNVTKIKFVQISNVFCKMFYVF